MQERKSVPFSKRCRELAKECRVRALLFQNEKPRDEMFRLADDYDRKALQAEELEATLQTPLDESPSLIPEIAEAFVSRLRVNAIQSDQRVTNPGEIGSRERDGDHRDPDKIVSSRLVKGGASSSKNIATTQAAANTTITNALSRPRSALQSFVTKNVQCALAHLVMRSAREPRAKSDKPVGLFYFSPH